MFEVRQVFGQFERFEVVEDERHFAAVFDAGVADGDVADPVVGGQARQVDQRRQLAVVGVDQLLLPVAHQAAQFGVQVEVHRKLDDPEAHGVADLPPESVHCARLRAARLVLVLAVGTARPTRRRGRLLYQSARCFAAAAAATTAAAAAAAAAFFGRLRIYRRMQLVEVIGQVAVVFDAYASRPRDQHRIGTTRAA